MAGGLSPNLDYLSRVASAQFCAPPRHSKNHWMASRQSETSYAPCGSHLPFFLPDPCPRWHLVRSTSSHSGTLHRPKTLRRIFCILPAAANRLAITTNESASRRFTKSGNGRRYRRLALRSLALAQSRIGSAHIYWRHGNVLAVRTRSQHSSARARSSHSRRPGLVGVPSRLASFHAGGPRLLHLHSEVIMLRASPRTRCLCAICLFLSSLFV